MKNETLLKILSTILAVVMVLCSAPLSAFTGIELPDLFSVKAEAYTEGVFTYSVSGGKAKITDCDSSVSGDLIIPATLGGYPVTSIRDEAFGHCFDLTSVTIPDSVTSIGRCAFADCDSLTSVTIPDSVTSIGDAAFDGCKSLTSVTIPDSVTSIDDAMFWACYSLTSVTIPDNVTSIGACAFAYCTSLTSVTIGDSVTSIGDSAFYACENLTDVYYNGTEEEWNEITIGSYNEDLLNATIHFAGASTPAEDFKYTIENSEVTITKYIGSDTEVAIPSEIEGYPVTSIGSDAFYSCYSLTSVTIGDSVTSIGDWAFGSCDSLTSVTIPDSVTSIGEGAFYSCDSLTSVTIGDSVTSIGEGAFYSCTSLTSVAIGDSVTSIGSYVFCYCTSLTSVTIPDSVTSIGNYAFCYCTSLTSVTIPDSVTSMGEYTFYKCTSLTSVTIPDSVTSIGDAAFAACTSLTLVTIPDSVTSIGSYAFEACDSLTSIIVDSDNQYYSSDEYGALYNKDKTTLIQYPIGNSRETFKIPDSVTSIGNYAFYDCDSLTSVTIPDSATSIGSYAFSYCDSLTSVTIGNSVTSIGNYAFYDCENLTDVYYNGTEEEWNEITIGTDNENLLNATIHFIDEICEHEYVTSVTAPTCTKKGFTTYVCSLCYESYVGDFVDATGHTPEDAVEENRVESTCTEEGSCDIVIYCLICGEELSREKESIPMKEHLWSEWQVIVKPTDTKVGTEVRMCEVCEELEKRSILIDATVIYLTDLQGNILSKQYAEKDSDIISFENLADGEYTVTVSKETYVSREYTVTVSDGVASVEFSINKTGDMNGDGKVNTLDVARANAHAKGMSTLSGYDLACVDVNGDGKVNTVDVAKMNAHAKGVTTLW